jgi:beta-aspartyl-peptidase (threonine type)
MVLLLIVSIQFDVKKGIKPAQAQESESPLTAVRQGQCEKDDKFAIAVHGGAVFSRSLRKRESSFVQTVLTEARNLLFSGARGIDVVEAVIASMENSGIFNAGKGSIANEAGVIEMDASIMDGLLPKAGAVASVEAVRNPISAARLVMDKTRHVMLVGPDADQFVEENGGTMVDTTYFKHRRQSFSNVPLPENIVITPPGDDVSPDRAKFSGTWGGVAYGSWNFILVVEEIAADSAKVIWALGPHPYIGEGQYRRLPAIFVDEGIQVTEPAEMGGFTLTYQLIPGGLLNMTAQKPGEATEKHKMHRIAIPGADHDGGTVGAVVRDRCGDLAAGTSTGGFDSKIPGRVGDSPIIGAGTYANNETAAISATGHGEFFMRHVVAHDIAAAMKYKGVSLDEAATNIIKVELANKGGRGGVIAVDKDGNIAMPFNTEGMVRGTASNDLVPTVKVY